MRDKPIRVPIQEKNARSQSHCHIDNGESTLHQTHPSLQTNHGFHSSLVCSGSRDESCGALCDTDSREGIDIQNVEEDQMESEE